MSNCKYFTVRSKKGIRYIFCRYKKVEINYCDCKNCPNKEYKKYKKIKGKKHKRTKATDIKRSVKEAVWTRDKGKCIFCDTDVPIDNANAHFIPRSQGGLGIEENIVTACDFCHAEQDNGLNTQYYDKKAEKHLKSLYKNWKKENLIYKKENQYGKNI